MPSCISIRVATLVMHSLLTAIAGHVVCTALGAPREKDEAFVAGLRHDMGKVLILNHVSAGYARGKLTPFSRDPAYTCCLILPHIDNRAPSN